MITCDRYRNRSAQQNNLHILGWTLVIVQMKTALRMRSPLPINLCFPPFSLSWNETFRLLQRSTYKMSGRFCWIASILQAIWTNYTCILQCCLHSFMTEMVVIKLRRSIRIAHTWARMVSINNLVSQLSVLLCRKALCEINKSVNWKKSTQKIALFFCIYMEKI